MRKFTGWVEWKRKKNGPKKLAKKKIYLQIGFTFYLGTMMRGLCFLPALIGICEAWHGTNFPLDFWLQFKTKSVTWNLNFYMRILHIPYPSVWVNFWAMSKILGMIGSEGWARTFLGFFCKILKLFYLAFLVIFGCKTFLRNEHDSGLVKIYFRPSWHRKDEEWQMLDLPTLAKKCFKLVN